MKEVRDCYREEWAEAELFRNPQVSPGLSDYLHTAVDKKEGSIVL